MAKVDMTQFSTEELKNDLTECDVDIKLCKDAMAAGVMTYFGKSVGQRLSVNTLIKRDIEKELARRGE